jgi:biopolymer transport protein ExbB
MSLGRLLGVIVVLPTLALAQTEEAPAAPAVSVANSVLPRDLSVLGMFVQADWLVQAVMVGLAFASVMTWTVFLAKTVELALAARRQRAALAAIDRAPSLAKAPADDLVKAAQAELAMSAESDRDGIKERVASRLERLEAATGRRMLQGTGVLATIGATAPFVGLFGTVWGIMNSFIGISKAQTTNLAVVAPGIAEALLATALGLAAAIPAVVIYNHFSRRIAAHRALVADTSAAVLRLVSRDLGRR